MRPNTQLFLIGLSGLMAIIFDFFNFSIGFYVTKPLTTLLILGFPLRFPNDLLKDYSRIICWGLLC